MDNSTTYDLGLITSLLKLIFLLVLSSRFLLFIVRPVTHINSVLRMIGNDSKYGKFFRSPYAIIWLRITGIIGLAAMIFGMIYGLRIHTA
ncbi:MAG: hypothetical protein ACYC0V_06270 [Armatimonadota bacterium]